MAKWVGEFDEDEEGTLFFDGFTCSECGYFGDSRKNECSHCHANITGFDIDEVLASICNLDLSEYFPNRKEDSK